MSQKLFNIMRELELKILLIILSQKIYIKYFETFSAVNFYPSYIFLILKIIKFHFSHTFHKNGKPYVNNILQSFIKEKSYFISVNII